MVKMAGEASVLVNGSGVPTGVRSPLSPGSQIGSP
jgi:hypothetical protein